jgi:hypothetical protein
MSHGHAGTKKDTLKNKGICCDTSATKAPEVRSHIINKPLFLLWNLLEASPGIEPGYKDLQSSASPLRHEASRARYLSRGERLE